MTIITKTRADNKPYNRIVTNTREEWLQMRNRTGIGASEMASMLGLNKWESSVEVWERKTGKIPVEKESNLAMEIGSYMEDKIAELWGRVNQNWRIQRSNAILQSKETPHIFCSLDRVAFQRDERKKIVVECKWTDAMNRKMWDDGIPDYYFVQAQTQLYVTQFERLELPVLFGSREFRIFNVEPDHEFIKKMVEESAYFWHCVQEDIQPELHNTELTSMFVRKAFRNSNPAGTIKLDIERYMPVINDINAKAAQNKEIDNILESQKATIQNAMGENETAYCGNYCITWKKNKSGVRVFKIQDISEK